MSQMTKAWLQLLALSAGSTLLAASGLGGFWLVAAVLLLAGLKARVILKDYLGLSVAPGWLRGFELGLSLLLLALAGLALAG